MTMEWPKVETNGSRYQVDGWGVPHQCKSWVCWTNSPFESLSNNEANKR